MPEARAARDAAGLGALGAVNIAWCLVLGGAIGRTFYNSHGSFPYTRTPDGTAWTTSTSTPPDRCMMNTTARSSEAQLQAAFMREYPKRLGHLGY
jgi:uncharacterized protein